MTIPVIVTITELNPISGLDVGALPHAFAVHSWQKAHRTSIIVDADPWGRATLWAKSHGKAPTDEAGPCFDDYLLSAAVLDELPDYRPWKVSRDSRRLIPAGPDPLGAHARALAAVIELGGALSLGYWIEDLLRPVEKRVHQTIVMAPAGLGGLSTLLCSRSDIVVLLGATISNIGPALSRLNRLARNTELLPDIVLPVCLGVGLPRALLEPQEDRDELVVLAPLVLVEETPLRPIVDRLYRTLRDALTERSA